MAIVAGSKINAADLVLPASVAGDGNGANTITATSWTDLPTNGATATITNPHPTLSMLVQVGYGCWMSSLTNGVRSSVRASGGVTVASGPGAIFQNWGEIPWLAGTASTLYMQFFALGYLTIPAGVGAVTLTAQAYRDVAAGTQQVNYPTIRLTPQRYV